MNLVDEHKILGYECQACHSSTASRVLDAIRDGDQRCLTCHPDSAHNQRQAFEFNPRNASGHNVESNIWPKTSFTISGKTYLWDFPTRSVFTSGWNENSIMTCESCHTYDKTKAVGPHGGQVKVNIDPAYPNPYRADPTKTESNNAQLSDKSPTGMSMSKGGSQRAGIICEKCHDLYDGSRWSNQVHDDHTRGNEGGYCTFCHVAVPHGWDRPRLMGYTTDPEPYATMRQTPVGGKAANPSGHYGNYAISLKDYRRDTDGTIGKSWDSKAFCAAGCDGGEKHPLKDLSGSKWP